MKNQKIDIFLRTVYCTVILIICYIPTSFATEELTVVLDWFLNVNHAPLLVAEQQGFFRQQQLKVRLIQPTDPTDGEKMVAAQRADLALSYQTSFALQLLAGLPLSCVATLIDHPLAGVIVLKKTGISRLQQLKGKRIGISKPGIDELILSTMLHSVGLSLADIQLLNIKFNLTQALLHQKIDAFVGGMRNFEPLVLAAAKQTNQMFYVENYGFPQYSELIFIAHRNNLNNKKLQRFLIAVQQGLDYLRHYPTTSWRNTVQQYPILNNQVNWQIWQLNLQHFTQRIAYCADSQHLLHYFKKTKLGAKLAK